MRIYRVPIVEALGASAVAQPVNVINQNLTNGVIDAIAIGPSAIGSFALQEPANYLTTWFPGSGSAFVLLMNSDVYNGLSDQEKAWVDEAADQSLSEAGGAFYDRAADRGLKIAADAGVEIIELSAEEQARWEAAIAGPLADVLASNAGPRTVAEVLSIMKGSN